MKYQVLFSLKTAKNNQLRLSSAAVMTDALRVNSYTSVRWVDGWLAILCPS